MRAGAESVARAFAEGGRVNQMSRHPGGHIHDTWVVQTACGGLVVQRLNGEVFPDLDLLMDNVVRVTDHLESHLRRSKVPDADRRALRVVPAGGIAGAPALVHDEEGGAWRAFRLVERAVTHQVITRPSVAGELGKGLGSFLSDVQDLPGPVLEEPIPGFKDFQGRRAQFEAAVERDSFGRVATSTDEIEAVRSRHDLADQLSVARAAGQVPDRLVHNDARSNNVLVDQDTDEVRCVIDLDTVAPGSVLFDVGDLLRSATVTSGEDATDLAELAVRDDLLEAAVQGYVGAAGPLLTGGELALFPLAGPLMAYENAMRFLTDHLEGDVYYRIARPRHNLERARAQLRVLEALASARQRVAELVGQVTA